MSDVPQGPGWWQASDGLWYSPDQLPGAQPTQPGFDAPQAAPTQPGWGASAPQQPMPGPGYPTMGYGQPVAMGPQNDSMAITSMVLGIVGVPLMCCYIGWAAGIAAIVVGILSRNKIKASNGALTGDGMALAGIICGGVVVSLTALWVVLVVFLGVAGSFAPA